MRNSPSVPCTTPSGWKTRAESRGLLFWALSAIVAAVVFPAWESWDVNRIFSAVPGMETHRQRERDHLLHSKPMDLNRVTYDDLLVLPGIGDKMAGKIIAWREKHGRFANLADLQQIVGLGPQSIRRWEKFLVVRDFREKPVSLR